MRAPLFSFVLPAFVLSCGGAQFPRETRVANAQNGDPWLDGEPCPVEGMDESALRIQDVDPGSGGAVARGDTVRVHYAASLASGTTVHDSRANGLAIELVIGSGKTMCGFDRALVGMHAGGQRRVTVPWKLALGEAGRAPNVPPQSDLMFVIDLYLPADGGAEPHSGPVNPARGRRR